MLKAIMCAGVLSISVACGGGGGDDVDAADIDAPIDAAPLNRSGTISVFDVVTVGDNSQNPAVAVPDSTGATILVEFTDTTTAKAPDVGEFGLGKCSVTYYAENESRATRVNEGQVTIKDTQASGDITCDFNSQLSRYVCRPPNPTGTFTANTTTLVRDPARPDCTQPQNLADPRCVTATIQAGGTLELGTYITMTGWDVAAYNNTPFPIIGGQAGVYVIGLTSSAAIVADTAPAQATPAAYGLTIGDPIPKDPTQTFPNYDFLDGSEINITKTAGDNIGTLDILKMNPQGQDGQTELSVMAGALTNFPTTQATQDYVIECTGDGTSCDADTADPEFAITGWVLSGSATNNTPNTTDTTEADFVCQFAGTTKITIPAEIVNAINGKGANPPANFAPNRIQLRALRSRARTALPADGTNVISGHAVVQFLSF